MFFGKMFFLTHLNILIKPVSRGGAPYTKIVGLLSPKLLPVFLPLIRHFTHESDVTKCMLMVYRTYINRVESGLKISRTLKNIWYHSAYVVVISKLGFMDLLIYERLLGIVERLL